MWMAIAEQHRNNVSGASVLFDQALAAQEPNSADALLLLEVYSLFLDPQGRADEARSTRERAAVLRKTSSGMTAALRPPPSADVYRIGGGITAPTLLSKIEPEYTEEARAALLQGTVVLSIEIGADGVPRKAVVVRGLGLGLDERAVETISQWRFHPGLKDGEPVNVAATIEVDYRLF